MTHQHTEAKKHFPSKTKRGTLMEPLKLTGPHYMFCGTPAEEHWCTVDNNFPLKLPTALPQKYKCHVEQYNFLILHAGWVHLNHCTNKNVDHIKLIKKSIV